MPPPFSVSRPELACNIPATSQDFQRTCRQYSHLFQVSNLATGHVTQYLTFLVYIPLHTPNRHNYQSAFLELFTPQEYWNGVLTLNKIVASLRSHILRGFRPKKQRWAVIARALSKYQTRYAHFHAGESQYVMW